MSRFAPNEIITLVGEAPRFDLGGSYGPHLALRELLDGDIEVELRNLELGYGSAPGDSSLRREIAAINGVDEDDVVITAGSAHALFLLSFILCAQGDEAVIASPVFPPARGALESIGAQIRVLPLSFDRGYRLDAVELGTLLTQRTKLVSLASPQNPSGVAIPLEVIAEVLTIMRERAPQAYLLVDDVYREAAFGDDPTAPSALTLGDKVVTIASLSKCHGAPGLRVGWAITRDRALREQLVRGKFMTVVSAPSLDERLALRVLTLRDRILSERRVFLAQCLERTERWVAANSAALEWVRPDAGAICCVRLKRDVFDDAAVERFYAELQRAGVRVSNGTWFGEEARVFRLGFAHLALNDLDAAYDVMTSVVTQIVNQRDTVASWT
jgi:aspartate/methionine/tyrosine aminotransferase